MFVLNQSVSKMQMPVLKESANTLANLPATSIVFSYKTPGIISSAQANFRVTSYSFSQITSTILNSILLFMCIGAFEIISKFPDGSVAKKKKKKFERTSAFQRSLVVIISSRISTQRY